MCKGQIKNKKTVYLFILSLMLIVTTVFLNSFYWPYKELTKRKLLVGMIAFFCVIIFPILCVKMEIMYKFIQKNIHYAKNRIAQIKKQKKRVCFLGGIFAIALILSYVSTYVFFRFVLQTTFNVKIFYTMVAFCATIFAMLMLWKHASRKPEIVFLIVALIMGTLVIGITPKRVGVSWDDEVHYTNTLEISNFLNGIMYVADERNINEYISNIYSNQGYDRKSAMQYETELKDSYEAKEWNLHKFSKYGVWSVAYIPSALGIILGRGLDLSYTSVFNMGRLVNLLCYIFLICCAIKRIKHGKVLVATIGLIPTTIFMAASYSYDWWVTGFTILGFSYFFAELQEDSLLNYKNILIMVGAIVLGCMPKAIYFPILFPLLFMPKEKFATEKQRNWYYVFIIGTGILLVLSFLLPVLIQGAGEGDYRGGEGVNSTEQIIYILSHPVEYAKMLLLFLKDYVSLRNTGPMLQRFAYVGEGNYYGVICMMLPIVAFLDRGDQYKRNLIVRGAGMIGCIVALILSATALYISFTAVGANTVAGMQGRYLVPFIFPTLYLLGAGGTTHRINKNAFVCIPMCTIALTFIINMLELCVLRY